MKKDFKISEPDEGRVSYRYPPQALREKNISNPVQENSCTKNDIKILKGEKRLERVTEICNYGIAVSMSGLGGAYAYLAYELFNAQSTHTPTFSMYLIGMGISGIAALSFIYDGSKIGKKADKTANKISELEEKLKGE